MRIVLTGGTGFIGRALVPALLREGHSVVIWTRSQRRARARLGAEIETADVARGDEGLREALEGCDAVINLAGESLLGRRWTAVRRQALHDSRVGITDQLVRAIGATTRRPHVLVSGSAVGYYGDRVDERLDESSSAGTGALADLCRAWEAAADQATQYGVRVVTLRTGIVLGRDGGALAQMLPAFQLGLGGPIGSGRQYWPWIHLHDLVAAIIAALVDNRYRGPLNATAPSPVTSREFGQALGRQLGRPARLPVPVWALRLLFGQAAAALTGSQRVDPAVLRAHGFSFSFPTIDRALTDIVGGTPVAIRRFAGSADTLRHASDASYLERHPPIYELCTTTKLDVPVDEAFAFFSKAENLGALTPSAMRFAITGQVPDIAEGTTIDYRFRVGPVPVGWQSRIVDWRPSTRFVDQQERGPYRSWYHEHSFRADGTATIMEDRVFYAPPLSLLGRLANRLFIVPTLRRVFQYRADVIRLRFGAE